MPEEDDILPDYDFTGKVGIRGKNVAPIEGAVVLDPDVRAYFPDEASVNNALRSLIKSYLDQPLEPDPVIEAYKKDVDLTLIRRNLMLTPTERLQKLEEMQAWAIELRKAGERVRGKTD